MRRLCLLVSLCAVAALASGTAHASVITTVSGSSTFTLDLSSQNPQGTLWKTATISQLSLSSQSAAAYPPIGTGSVRVTLADLQNKVTSSASVNLYTASVTDAAGTRRLEFSGLGSDGTCYGFRISSTGTGASAPATLELAIGAAPCVGSTSLSGTGTASFVYTTT